MFLFSSKMCFYFPKNVFLFSSFFSTAESIQLCYTSHFIVVVGGGGGGSIGIDVVNKFLLHDSCGCFCGKQISGCIG